jgi:Tfp pilus assembly protein PilX
MGTSRRNERGFTLVAALMTTILLSGVAVGLIYLVNSEVRVGGNDLESNLAYYAAEAQMENLTGQLDILYQTNPAPKAADINALWQNQSNWATSIAGANITNVVYSNNPMITWPQTNTVTGADCTTKPNNCATSAVVQAGENAGMVAAVVPYTLNVTATRQNALNSVAATGATVSITRNVEVALVPAFEYGIFCDGDCDYFAGPAFNFGGRVHTNGNLFLASGSTLTFTDKIAAYDQVVLDRLENGHPTSSGYTGATYIPTAAGGCPAAPGAGPAANCLALSQGSWTGGFPPPPSPDTPGPADGGAANGAWKGVSSSFGGYVVNGLTGAKKLQLPFVQSSKVGAVDIIRRPQLAGANADSQLLFQSRLYSQAAIRILLADTLADLHPERGAAALDADDVQVVPPNVGGNFQLNYVGAPANSYMYFATAQQNQHGWVQPVNPVSPNNLYRWSQWPLLGQITNSPADVNAGPAGNDAGAWLRVEYLNAAGKWVGVTRQWLGYGLGRAYNVPPTAPWGSASGACPFYGQAANTYGRSINPPAGQCYNQISPAILILQQLQQSFTAAPNNAYAADGGNNTSNTAFNWIPINFYDSHEGEPRDNGTRSTNTTTSTTTAVYTPCSPIGVMNAVELDVGNLWLWLQGQGPYAGGAGTLVSTTDQFGVLENGYILYFSDHRGMRADSHAPYNTFYNGMAGSSGLEDTVNSNSSTGVPDNALEQNQYYTFSPEDVNQDNALDIQGETYIAAGFGLTNANGMSRPYLPIPANATTVKAGQVNCSADIQKAGVGNVLSLFDPATPGVEIVGSPQNNMVTGPRHVLRLVDAGMNPATNVTYLPHPASLNAPNNTGNGFSVASEEPVYVWGDYNTGVNDPLWTAGAPNYSGALHSATAIIADSVTLLSNPPAGNTLPVNNMGWTDVRSFLFPGMNVPSTTACIDGRCGNTSYYRVAIAAGKSIPFPQPSWAGQDFGTDGGMHNFLRYLEDRSAKSQGATVNYSGSLISMYYSQYATGVFKCCNVVYSPPARNYFFDALFLNPNNLPPGTPMFQDVVSLSYHQNFTPQ